jgi:hypothetical protein
LLLVIVCSEHPFFVDGDKRAPKIVLFPIYVENVGRSTF